MLEILLIRHGQTDWNRDRRIMGDLPIPLNATGRREAKVLKEILRSVSLEAVYTSPLARARQTAREIARGRRVRVIEAPGVAEIDYGLWVGRTFDEVCREKSYRVYHTTPARAQPPQGEKMTGVFRRAVGFIEGLRKRHSEGRVAVVSHADVIKIILLHYLKLDLNDLPRLRIDNGSLSSLWFNGNRSRVLGINCHADLRNFFQRTDQLIPKREGKGV